MKYLIAVLFASTFCTLGLAQTKASNAFYRSLKPHSDVSLRIPGVLVRMGTSIASAHVEDEEEKAALEMGRKVKKIRILHSEKAINDRAKHRNKFYKALNKEGFFEPLVIVRDKGVHASIYIHENENRIENLLIYHEEGSEFNFISIDLDVAMEELNAFLNGVLDKQEIELDVEL